MRKTTAFMSILATSLISFAAAAQPEGAPPAAAPPEGAPPAAAAPEAAPAEPAAVLAPAAAPAGDASGLTLPTGAFQVTVPVVLNLSKDAVLKPVWIPLDLRYGVSNELTLFVGHSIVGASPAFSYLAQGGGVCLGGKDRNCPKLYNNVAIGGLYSISKSNGLELAGLAALNLRSLDPMLLGIDVGVAVKYVSAPLSVTATPQVGIGANKRSSNGNKEFLSIPVQVAFQASSELSVFANTGIFGPTDHFGDLYVIPVGIGAGYAAQPGLTVGAEFMLPMVATGLPDNKAMDVRMLSLFATYRTN